MARNTGVSLLLQELAENGRLSRDNFAELIGRRQEARTEAAELAVRIQQRKSGKQVFRRALIECTNYCRNNCSYCGIRCANRNVSRYRLPAEEILTCCGKAFRLGFRTFVLQGGEDAAFSPDAVAGLARTIKARFPEWAEARKACLEALKACGYQTGSGFMTGSPGQTAEHLAEDLLFLADLQPEMAGIGPFIPHPQTPFAAYPQGSAELTTFLLSVVRILLPDALIPATTALATIAPDGREQGILSGANVVMPNISPENAKRNYEIYQGKISEGAESAEGLAVLRERIQNIGYVLSDGRGDFSATERQDAEPANRRKICTM